MRSREESRSPKKEKFYVAFALLHGRSPASFFFRNFSILRRRKKKTSESLLILLPLFNGIFNLIRNPILIPILGALISCQKPMATLERNTANPFGRQKRRHARSIILCMTTIIFFIYPKFIFIIRAVPFIILCNSHRKSSSYAICSLLIGNGSYFF